jgi:hypothetical protein
MKVLIACLLGLWRLFVDDGPLAAGLVLWIVVAAVLVPELGLAAIGGPVLFCGAAVVMIASVLQAARRRRS